MTTEAQTSAESARRRPLVQFVIVRRAGADLYPYEVQRSAAGSKPSHWMIEAPAIMAIEMTLAAAREKVPPGFKRMDRRKDDRADVVEVWV